MGTKSNGIDKKAAAKPGSVKSKRTVYVETTQPVGVVAEAAVMLEERTERMDSMEDMVLARQQISAGKASNTRASDQVEEDRLARRLIAEVSRDNADVNSLCGAYKLKREELGRLTGFSLRALAEWAGGKLPSQPAKRRLHEVRRLLDALAEIVKVESIPQWLHQPNPGFERLTPLQVIEVGEMDRLWAMVHDLGSGQPA